MQLVNTSRDSLLKPLQVVSGIVERRHTLPILANLLFKKQAVKTKKTCGKLLYKDCINSG